MPGKISSLSDELEMVSKIPAKHPLKNRLSIGFTLIFGDVQPFNSLKF